jgi:cyclic beta-1,2-glucan synthetase
MFMAKTAPVKFTRLRLVNCGPQARRLSMFSYLRWVLGDLPGKTAACVVTSLDGERKAILATNSAREFYGQHVAFSAVCLDERTPPLATSHSGDRAAFIGDCGDLSAPAAITSRDQLDNRTGSGLDPCAAWQVSIDLPPGGEYECTFLLGEASSRQASSALTDAYQTRGQIEEALDEVKAFWRETVSAVQVETPHREIDLLVNGWLSYQNISCRLWGRSSFYQPGGAIGFRDQLQDAAALIYQRPDITRRQILCHAAQQFVEGDVLHWWHPDTGYGLRTRFSDDLLWLPYITATYVHATGDVSVLDETAPFLKAPQLASGVQELYLRPEQSKTSATLYEHCCRSLDVGLTTGPHGLPLMGCGDWNDGMNRVGQRGQGESVWLGFFICSVLDEMLPICREKKDHARVERYAAYRDRLVESLNTAGWDGAWYRRAYYDNGQPLGSTANVECRIDALVQAWAVLSGTAPKNRADMAVRSVEEQLVDEQAGIIRLLTPPFDRTGDDPGYIKGYLPGVRENGGQYTHGVLWFVRALAEMKRGSRAVELLRMLSPISHTASPEQVEIYQTEPYVMAADVYGKPPHVGRGGWTWYTGSAGWMFRVAVESILGLSLEQGKTLVLNPCISSSWPSCKVIYRLPGNAACYEVAIENPDGKESGVTQASVDGCDALVAEGVARIPLQRDGQTHRVVVRL